MRKSLVTPLATILVLAYGVFVFVLLAGYTPALGLDLQGGISVTQQPVGAYDPASLDLAVERIRERVDSLGVAEPEILRQDDTIVVNLPGVKNQAEAEKLVQVTGQVYLRPVLGCGAAPNPNATTTTTDPNATTTTDPNATTTTADPNATTTTDPNATTTTGSQTTTAAPGPARRVDGASGASTTVPATSATTTSTDGSVVTGDTTGAGDPNATTTTTATGDTVPGGVTTTTTQVVSDPTQQQVLPASPGEQCLVGPSGGTGEVFQNDASAQILQGQGWGVVVGLRGGAAGEDIWNALAAQCFNAQSTCPTRQLAIELDGVIVSHPTVNTDRFTGNVQISGSFTEGEAKDLARVLRSGSLPVRLEVVSTQTVSPSLGSDSLRAAVISGIVGVLLVLIFMILYYRTLGIVVAVGITVSGSIVWSIVSILSRTSGLALSLSGIAGMIVSVGVTVDSYVVFFERLKDEVRSGKSLRNSAQRGFQAAWRTIIVADLVSLIGAFVLWYLTVGAVRGFAFFLGLSTACDLLVSYVFTRPMVLLLARTQWMERRKVMGIEVATTGGAA
jgi:preprotein translocase subunit SecD